ncbi:hypothetical protein M405DRAFT_819033 [Rhizopogon salebrosus TDB-379]|nr:hypothetical protein M405DRAFT_819033 [Rhizopogon salebrosus TDB-379]
MTLVRSALADQAFSSSTNRTSIALRSWCLRSLRRTGEPQKREGDWWLTNACENLQSSLDRKSPATLVLCSSCGLAFHSLVQGRATILCQ